MDWWKSTKYYYHLIENFFFRIIFPIAGFCLLLNVTTPVGDLIGWKPSTEIQLSLLIFFSVSYGSKLLHATLGKGDKKIISFSSQDTAMENALSLIPSKGTNVDILIYTSFSIFNNYERLKQKYPHLNKSKLRILIRDPDIYSLLKHSSITETRKRQINTALDSLANQMEISNNFAVKFYPNEPWVRGIKIGHDHLFYSTYSNKRKSAVNVTFDAYSGTNIPWIYMSNDVPNVLPRDLESVKKFIDGFDSLYDLIWNQCTKTKSLLIDLDGTLYIDETASKYLKYEIPKLFYEHLAENEKIKSENIDTIYGTYIKFLDSGISSTESILLALENSENVYINLKEYLSWKDQKTDHLIDSIENNLELVEALKKAKESYRIFLLTNHTQSFAKKAINKIGCVESFENLISINELEVAKPSNKILSVLVNKYNIDISRSIFIGDRQAVDLDYAVNYCLGTVLVNDVRTLPKFLKDCWLPFTFICSDPHKYEGLALHLRNDFLKLS